MMVMMVMMVMMIIEKIPVLEGTSVHIYMYSLDSLLWSARLPVLTRPPLQRCPWFATSTTQGFSCAKMPSANDVDPK